MIPKSTDVFCGDLADNLLCNDNYTCYQISPAVDTLSYLPMSSTPDRVQRGIRSHWLDIPAAPPTTSTPRSFVMPSTPSLSMANMKMVFSPSPLPISQVPPLVFPEISPPSQGSGSTPFERQFVGDFFQGWNNINTHISPVLRRSFYSSFSLSPTTSNAGGTSFETDDGPASKDSQDGRVSLIDRFKSAAADEPLPTDSGIPCSTFLSQDRSSPLSDLSDLTSLSSSDDGFGSRSSSPPTSPTNDLRQSDIQYSDQPSNSGPEPFTSQSTRRSSRFRDSDYQPAKGTIECKRKRTSQSRDGNGKLIRRKKARFASAPQPTSTDASSSPGKLIRRRLPTNVPDHPQFSLLYLRFPVSSYLRSADGKFPLLSNDSKRPAGIYNKPRDPLDLYTPRFVKGCGATKVGVCPICIESPSRGGKDEAVWLSMKFSAYKWHVSNNPFASSAHIAPLTESRFSWLSILTRDTSSYHLQYAHGIYSLSGRPFSPPVAFRTVARQNAAKGERTSIQEGKCHKCNKWILVESIKNIDIKVKELYWWKHAATCHQGTHIDGDDDFFVDDEIYHRAQQAL